jgi:hypothetical protein
MVCLVTNANPELVETNALLKTASDALSSLDVQIPEQFLFAPGISIFVLLVGLLAFKVRATYVQLRFTLMHGFCY